jgi:hypothetical protein
MSFFAARRSLVVCLAVLFFHGQAVAQGEQEEAWRRQILTHLISLRAEFAEYFMEWHQSRVRELNRELEEVLQQQQRLQTLESQRVQHLADVEQQLATAQLEPPARPQIEALKHQLMTEAAGKLQSERAALLERQVTLRQRSQTEQERSNKLQRLLSALHAISNR